MRKLTDTEWAKVDNLVDKLECSIDEAVDILDADKAIDQGKQLDFDLSPEEHKKAMKLANVREHTMTTKTTRTKKIDDEKKAIIAGIAEFLGKCDVNCENISISNVDREIKFTVGANKYTITLIKNRK